MFKSFELLFNKFDEFQYRISNFEDILFTPKYMRLVWPRLFFCNIFMAVFIVLWSCLFTTKLSCLQKKTLVTLRVKQGSKDLNSCTWHSLSSRKKNDTEHWTQSDPVDQTNDVYKWKKKWVYVFLFFTNACVFPYFCIWNFFDICSTELWMLHR